MIRISVVVCTYNRPHLVRRVLDSLDQSSLPKQDFEVIVVDNSDVEDDMQGVLTGASSGLNWRIVRSAPPGLSRARNVGLAAAASEVIAFTDDDAEPVSTWLATLLTLFEEHPDALAIGGAVLPLWTNNQPTWLTPFSEAALSILDKPDKVAVLQPWEYLYGANIAFRRDALRSVGGFDESLGRKGKKALLSSEELDVQDKLRALGGKILYSADALVFHRVHEERLDQGWLRRRMAWQSVSDASLGHELAGLESSVSTLAKYGAQLGIDRSFLNAFIETDDPSRFESQLQFVRALGTLMLDTAAHVSESAQGMIEESFVHADTAPELKMITHEARPSSVLAPAVGRDFTYFFEPWIGHGYLYETYADVGPSSLVSPYTNSWDWSPEGIRATVAELVTLFHNAAEAGSSVCFLTLDNLLHRTLAEEIRRGAGALARPTVAILHRPPTDVAQMRALSELSRSIKIAVLGEEVASDLRKHIGINDVYVIPHHPTIGRYPPSQVPFLREVSGERIRFGLVGEIRDGKGLELLIEALEVLPEDTKELIHLVIAGKASAELEKDTRETLLRLNVSHTLGVRQGPWHQYAVLTDLEYADYIYSLDVGLLLYQGIQRRLMSGVLPSMIYAGVPVIATSSSHVGTLVERNQLGATVLDSPASLAEAMARMTDRKLLKKIRSSEAFGAYQSSTSAEAAVAALRDLLRGSKP